MSPADALLPAVDREQQSDALDSGPFALAHDAMPSARQYFVATTHRAYDTVTVMMPLEFQVIVTSPATSDTGPSRSMKHNASSFDAVSL